MYLESSVAVDACALASAVCERVRGVEKGVVSPTRIAFVFDV
jgi:hypothetical protein